LELISLVSRIIQRIAHYIRIGKGDAQRADNCAVLEDVLAAKKTAKNSTFERSPKMQKRPKKQNRNENFDLRRKGFDPLRLQFDQFGQMHPPGHHRERQQYSYFPFAACFPRIVILRRFARDDADLVVIRRRVDVT